MQKVREIIDSFYGELRLHKNYNIKKIRLKEAQLLSLDISKAKELNWEPRLSLDECIVLTSNWYINYISGGLQRESQKSKSNFMKINEIKKKLQNL